MDDSPATGYRPHGIGMAIRRFIDPEAKFQFAESKLLSSRAIVTFDMFGDSSRTRANAAHSKSSGLSSE